MAVVGTGQAVDTPVGSWQHNWGGHLADFGIAVVADAQRHAEIIAAAQLAFVDDGGFAAGQVGAGPLPIGEPVFQRLATMVRIEIALAAPGDIRVGEGDIDSGEGRERCPDVAALRIKAEAALSEHLRGQANLATHRQGQQRTFFLDIDGQRIAIPMDMAGTDLQRRTIPPQRALAPLGHRPAPATRAVEGDV